MTIAADSAEFGRRQCVIRVGPVSARASWRAIAVVTALMGGAFLVAIMAIGIGKYTVAPGDVLGVLVGSNDSFDRVVVLEWRMPRMLMALLIGASLGVSGAIFQALTHNALGSPDIIGVNSGAYTGALVVIAGIGGGYYAIATGALIGWPAGWGCCRRRRSLRKGSASPTSCPGDDFPTRRCYANGPEMTPTRFPTPCGASG